MTCDEWHEWYSRWERQAQCTVRRYVLAGLVGYVCSGTSNSPPDKMRDYVTELIAREDPDYREASHETSAA